MILLIALALIIIGQYLKRSGNKYREPKIRYIEKEVIVTRYLEKEVRVEDAEFRDIREDRMIQ